MKKYIDRGFKRMPGVKKISAKKDLAVEYSHNI